MTYKLSPSRMSLFIECERCFWLKVNKGIKRPSGPFPSLPGGVDDKIKDHFDSFRAKGEVPEVIEEFEEDLDLLPDQEFLEKARSWTTANAAAYHSSTTQKQMSGSAEKQILKNSKPGPMVAKSKQNRY